MALLLGVTSLNDTPAPVTTQTLPPNAIPRGTWSSTPIFTHRKANHTSSPRMHLSEASTNAGRRPRDQETKKKPPVRVDPHRWAKGRAASSPTSHTPADTSTTAVKPIKGRKVVGMTRGRQKVDPRAHGQQCPRPRPRPRPKTHGQQSTRPTVTSGRPPGHAHTYSNLARGRKRSRGIAADSGRWK